MSKKRTGKRIRQLILEKGLNAVQVQKQLELESPQSVYKWMYGYSLPSVQNLYRLSRLLDVEIKEILVCEEDDKP